MDAKNLRQEYIKVLAEKLESYGFKYSKSNVEFIKKNSDGWVKFTLLFTNWRDSWEINFGMLIRINKVQELFYYDSKVERRHQISAPTVGISIESFINDGKDYRVFSDDNISLNDKVSYTLDLFENIALPFFEKYNSIEKLDEEANKVDGIFIGLNFGGNVGIILAKLNNNPKYEELRIKYFNYYKKFYKGFYLNDFKRIVSNLDNLQQS